MWAKFLTYLDPYAAMKDSHKSCRTQREFSAVWRDRYYTLLQSACAAAFVEVLLFALSLGAPLIQNHAIHTLRDKLDGQRSAPPSIAEESEVYLPELRSDFILEFDPDIQTLILNSDFKEASATTYAGMFYDERIPLDEMTQGELGYAAQLYGLDPYLVAAVVKVETEYRNVATPGDGTGYMQVMYKWHHDRMERLGVSDLMIPADNFLVGCDYLSELVSKYGIERGLGAYNTGSPCVNSYVHKVMSVYESF